MSKSVPEHREKEYSAILEKDGFISYESSPSKAVSTTTVRRNMKALGLEQSKVSLLAGDRVRSFAFFHPPNKLPDMEKVQAAAAKWAATVKEKPKKKAKLEFTATNEEVRRMACDFLSRSILG